MDSYNIILSLLYLWAPIEDTSGFCSKQIWHRISPSGLKWPQRLCPNQATLSQPTLLLFQRSLVQDYRSVLCTKEGRHREDMEGTDGDSEVLPWGWTGFDCFLRCCWPCPAAQSWAHSRSVSEISEIWCLIIWEPEESGSLSFSFPWNGHTSHFCKSSVATYCLWISNSGHTLCVWL